MVNQTFRIKIAHRSKEKKEKEEKKEKILPASGPTDGRSSKVIHEVLADLRRAK